MGLMHMSRKMSRLKVRMKKIPLIAGTKGRRHKQHRLSSALCRRVIDVSNDAMLGRGSRQVWESHLFCSIVEDFDLFSCSLGFNITIHGVNDLQTWYRVTGGMCREGPRQGQDETRHRRRVQKAVSLQARGSFEDSRVLHADDETVIKRD